jgi:hypothetical protein
MHQYPRDLYHAAKIYFKQENTTEETTKFQGTGFLQL